MMESCETTLQVGNVLNEKYVILEFVEKGGMGEVYRAFQTSLNRDVAIKVISRDWIESIDDGDEEAETLLFRFRREVQAMAQIRHPNVLQVFDHDSISVKSCDKDTKIEYIAMEFIPGGSFRSTMSEEGYYPEEQDLKNWITRYFFPVLDGVEALHNAGIIHRDLKPENILMDHDIPKIADFGLARSNRLKPVTHSMDIKGSPHFMSPEHFFDFKRADQRADIYSLGKILFEAVEGKIQSGTIPFKSAKLTSAETPFFQKIDRIIQHATAEEKENRTESIQILRIELNEALAIPEAGKEKGGPLSQPPASTASFSHPKIVWAGILFTLISVLAMTAWHLMGEPGLDSFKNGKIDKITSGRFPGPGTALKNKNTFHRLEHRAKQHLIPGGELGVPESESGKTLKLADVDSFFVDEFLVTNHQYVNFLNQNLSRIRVENGVVKEGEKIWLFLGEVFTGYEPIIYRNGEFDIMDPERAASPVLRVTAYGASAYAEFFGRRLPRDIELFFLALKGKERAGKQDGKPLETSGLKDTSGDMMVSMHGNFGTETSSLADYSKEKELPMNPRRFILPASNYPPDLFRIRAIWDGPAEWATSEKKTSADKNDMESIYLVFGEVDEGMEKRTQLPQTIGRHPWEAFERVGFRTAKTKKEKPLSDKE